VFLRSNLVLQIHSTWPTDKPCVACSLALQQVTVLRNVKVKVEGSYPGLPCLRATTVPPDRLLCLTRDVRGALPHTRRHGASVRWTLNIRRRLQPTPLPVNVSDSLEDFSIEREKGEKKCLLCNVFNLSSLSQTFFYESSLMYSFVNKSCLVKFLWVSFFSFFVSLTAAYQCNVSNLNSILCILSL